MAQERTRRLTAVWFADITGYTELSASDEDAAISVVEYLQTVARRVVTEQGGRIVKFQGDAVLAVFDSVDSAARSALALAASYGTLDAARERGCFLRIGVHAGELVEAEDGDIYGDGVNLASRIESSANPGEIAVSEDVYRQLRQRTEFVFQRRKPMRMKGIAGPVVTYRLVSPATVQAGGGGSPAAMLGRAVLAAGVVGAVVAVTWSWRDVPMPGGLSTTGPEVAPVAGPTEPARGTLSLLVTFVDANDRDEFWVYLDRRIVAGRHPLQGGRVAVAVASGRHLVEIGTVAATTVATGEGTAINSPLLFFAERDVEVEPDATREVEFVLPPKRATVEPRPTEREPCVRGAWSDRLDRDRRRVASTSAALENDPVFIALRTVAPARGDSVVHLDLVERGRPDSWHVYNWEYDDSDFSRALEYRWRTATTLGPRQYAPRQVRLLIDWLDRRYWDWYAPSSGYDLDACFGPVPEPRMGDFEALDARVEERRAEIRALAALADRLEAAR